MKDPPSSEVSCRACLLQRRSLRSIFQRVGSHTYAEMIGVIANVKMHPNDGFSDKICLICRTKVQEAYDFKSMVEQSDRLLWLGNNIAASGEATVKKLVFNDISEVKVKIEGCKLESDLDNTAEDVEDVKLDFENCEDEIFYNNTMIRKCTQSEETEEMHVEDFIKNIKNELPEVEYTNEQEYFDDWRDNDEEYFPPGTTSAKTLLAKISGKKRKKQKGGKKSKQLKSNKNDVDEKENSKTKAKMVKLKPVYLEDISLVPSKPQFPKTRKKRKEKCTSMCPYCGRITNSIKKHILQHTGEKKYKCAECRSAYFTEKELQNHVRKHTGIKEFKCNQCSAEFYDKHSLNSHFKTHKETRDCVCTSCGKGFKRKGTLIRHMLRHSSANKVIQCEQCNMSFFEKWQLDHHMRIHTGERPFKCELCSQPYSYKHDFNRHCFKKHGVFMKRRNIRVMNEQFLQEERATIKAALKGQRSLEDLRLTSKSGDVFNKGPHIVDAAQLKILFNDC